MRTKHDGGIRHTDPAWILVAIVLVGAILRFTGIAFGLPQTQARPDESRILNIALRIAAGDLNPHYFVYPTLYMYLLAGVIKAGSLVPGTADFRTAGLEHFLVYGRCFTAALGTLTIVPVYMLARRLRDRWCGVIAAAISSVAFLHVRDSHFGTLDVPMAFGVVTGLVLLLESDRGMRWVAAAGATIGLATSIKYNAALLMLAAVALEATTMEKPIW
jgi:4-amino-4-deoxy-L-arabinose transferase-like glycosyltransferase